MYLMATENGGFAVESSLSGKRWLLAVPINLVDY
jgi:hypothetical protein